MIRNIFTSKSIWGAWLAYGFGLLVYSFAAPITPDSGITLVSLGLIVPPGIGLFIKWMDARNMPDESRRFMDLNPDEHFIKGFLSQFIGIIAWLLIASAYYSVEDWYSDAVNLAVFISGTLIASVLVHVLIPIEVTPTQEEEIENGN